jgi:hypothetical protein
VRTDSAAATAGALGILEDEMAEMEHWYANAAGDVAAWEHEYRRLFLLKREELKQLGVWPKGTTETEKKNDIDYALQVEHEHELRAFAEAAKTKAIGDKLFASRDARRSIGQTIMKLHLRDEDQYGQSARGQAGLAA